MGIIRTMYEHRKRIGTDKMERSAVNQLYILIRTDFFGLSQNGGNFVDDDMCTLKGESDTWILKFFGDIPRKPHAEYLCFWI